MISVKVDYNDQKISRFVVSGHAMYETYGKDIVCSAVSSCVITTVNAILEIAPDSILVEQAKEIVIEVQKMDTIVLKLLQNMLDMLKSLENQYPKNIKFQ